MNVYSIKFGFQTFVKSLCLKIIQLLYYIFSATHSFCVFVYTLIKNKQHTIETRMNFFGALLLRASLASANRILTQCAPVSADVLRSE